MYSTFYNFLDKKRSHIFTPIWFLPLMLSQPTFAYSNLKIETLEQGVKYVQS